ncbi:MAG: Smr/MutS family protein [Alphaproteobacteria bacterium]|jgi:DNA-nicking Smr family endonuclease|nr:Smr/MutS family protein [Alphaproteobacteria bacterium]
MQKEIDLHGETQNEAFSIVKKAVINGFINGEKTLRIVTGKSGILKQKLPLWLEAEQFEEYIRKTDFDRNNTGVLIIYLKKNK